MPGSRTKSLLGLTASLVGIALLLLGPRSASALPPFTTSAKTSPASGGQAEVFRATAGRHSTYGRFVIRARAATPGYDVRYVNRIFEDASGDPVSLLGSKRIRVLIRDARGHTQGGTNLLPRVITPRCANLLQIKDAGDFEGLVTFGLGLRRKTGFRVFRLTGPTRIVIDVAHWRSAAVRAASAPWREIDADGQRPGAQCAGGLEAEPAPAIAPAQGSHALRGVVVIEDVRRTRTPIAARQAALDADAGVGLDVAHE